jgi:hypothetical protein
MPEKIERLRRTWYELLSEHLIGSGKINRLKKEKNLEAIQRYIHAVTLLRFISMNLRNKNEEQTLNHKPMLIFEDDIKFLRS